MAPKDGDTLRFRYAAFTKDGKLVSRREGVEQSTKLGQLREVPMGLQSGLRGMKVGGERLLVIPPALGWTAKLRAANIGSIKPCDSEDKCPLNTENVFVRVVLVGYKREECEGGDMPMTVDTSALMKDGTVVVNFGTDKCPEGDIEVTYERVKTKMMLDKLKDEGKLKAAEKQRFYTPAELKERKTQ